MISDFVLKEFLQIVRHKNEVITAQRFNDWFKQKHGFNAFSEQDDRDMFNSITNFILKQKKLKDVNRTWNVKIKNYSDDEFAITKFKYDQMTQLDYTENKNSSGVFSNLSQDEKYETYINKTRSLLYDYFRTNKDDLHYFITLTIEPDKVKDRTDNKEVTAKISMWLRNHKRKHKDFNWIGVKEFHEKRYDNGKKALHFHILTNGIGLDFKHSGYVKLPNIKGATPIETAIKHGNTYWQDILHIKNYHYGWHSALVIDNMDATFKYMLKYISKDMIENMKDFNYKEKKILVSRNIKKPTMIKRDMTRQQLLALIDMIEKEYDRTNDFQDVFRKSYSYSR